MDDFEDRDLIETKYVTILMDQLVQPLIFCKTSAQFCLKNNFQSNKSSYRYGLTTKQTLNYIALLSNYNLELIKIFKNSLQFDNNSLECISVNAMLSDVSKRLQPLAEILNVTININKKTSTLAFSSSNILSGSLYAIGYSLLWDNHENQSNDIKLTLQSDVDNDNRSRIMILMNNLQIQEKDLHRAKSHTSSSQLFPNSLSGKGAGILIADKMLQSINSTLKIINYNNQTGFVINVNPAKQMTLLY